MEELERIAPAPVSPETAPSAAEAADQLPVTAEPAAPDAAPEAAEAAAPIAPATAAETAAPQAEEAPAAASSAPQSEPEAPAAPTQTPAPAPEVKPAEPAAPAEPRPALSAASRSPRGAKKKPVPAAPAAPVMPAAPVQPEPPAFFTVVDVRFRSGGKTYFFDPGPLGLAAGDEVILDTARGPEFGTCASGCHTVPSREVVAPLRRVLRKATAADQKTAAENREKEKRAFSICQQKILDHKLDMQLVSVECAFDGSKILFFFTADGRVDFRDLVKNLASIFRTRIELRQIGVRDKAKMVGGLGICGRPFCCTEFLDDFQPVSIKMAKTQNLSLNPTKISGTCGRLMCCLKYEQDAYEDLLKTAPKADSFVDTPDGRGTILDVNLLRQTVRVRMEDQPDTIGTYANADICVLRSGKAKKNDPPIPKDLAPISSRRKGARPAEKPAEPLPSLEPVIFRSDAIQTPVRPPQPEQPAPDAEPKEPREPREPGARNSRRRKKPAGENGQPPRPAGEAREPREPREPREGGRRRHQDKPRTQEKPRPQEAAAPDAEGGEKKPRSGNNSRRRYHRRKPKTPGAPDAQG